jgi:hypothetical protein
MSKQKRVILTIALAELMLAALWYYLNDMALTSPNATAESTRVIGEMLGMAMGAMLGLGVVLFLMARKSDRAAAQSSAGGE